MRKFLELNLGCNPTQDLIIKAIVPDFDKVIIGVVVILMQLKYKIARKWNGIDAVTRNGLISELFFKQSAEVRL